MLLGKYFAVEVVKRATVQMTIVMVVVVAASAAVHLCTFDGKRWYELHIFKTKDAHMHTHILETYWRISQKNETLY